MMTKLTMTLVTLCSMAALAGPPGRGPGMGPGPGPGMGPGMGMGPGDGFGPGPGAGPGRFATPEERAEHLEQRARSARMMYVVAISDALELNEAEALRLAEKLKGVEEKRRPLRQQMMESMRALHDAAEGDKAALGQVDVNVQRVLDGRAQMAAMDKELFQVLSKDLPPQKKAKLALVLARLNQERRGPQPRRFPRR